MSFTQVIPRSSVALGTVPMSGATLFARSIDYLFPVSFPISTVTFYQVNFSKWVRPTQYFSAARILSMSPLDIVKLYYSLDAQPDTTPDTGPWVLPNPATYPLGQNPINDLCAQRYLRQRIYGIRTDLHEVTVDGMVHKILLDLQYQPFPATQTGAIGDALVEYVPAIIGAFGGGILTVAQLGIEALKVASNYVAAVQAAKQIAGAQATLSDVTTGIGALSNSPAMNKNLQRQTELENYVISENLAFVQGFYPETGVFGPMPLFDAKGNTISLQGGGAKLVPSDFGNFQGATFSTPKPYPETTVSHQGKTYPLTTTFCNDLTYPLGYIPQFEGLIGSGIRDSYFPAATRSDNLNQTGLWSLLPIVGEVLPKPIVSGYGSVMSPAATTTSRINPALAIGLGALLLLLL